jgi:hypothetical protein
MAFQVTCKPEACPLLSQTDSLGKVTPENADRNYWFTQNNCKLDPKISECVKGRNSSNGMNFFMNHVP